jgi:serine/threonine-protein kinase
MVDDIRMQELIRDGRYDEAACLCLEAGQPARAAELLAAVWKYPEAVAIATEAGLFDEAYRHALASGDGQLSASLLAHLEARPEQAARAAVHAEARGRLAEAARLREAAADLAAAADLYERAGELADAARCALELGDLRRAGKLYERRLREAPDDAHSALELGQILVRLGRWDHAVRALQIAANDRTLAAPAGRLLIAAFHALGMTDAAQARLDTLRKLDPSLPATVPEMLAATFGDPRGPRAANAEQLLLGRYRIVRTLGAGGTGRVLLAEDAFYGREVAIKALHAAGLGAAGRDAMLRFAREARVAAGIEHPNVVRIYDYHGEGPFLVMEYMPGGTLEDRFREAGGPLAPLIVRHVLRSVLSALEAVHRRGVIHRDLKPANVFFGATGEVKLGDFGVAHLADVGTTMTGAMVGSLAYMAPEQITGATRPDASTDLYALGVIAYRALTGSLPFPGPDFVAQHLESIADPVSSRAPWLGAQFDAFVARLLEKEPSRRPRTATEVLEVLDRLPWPCSEPNAPVAVSTASSAPRSEASAGQPTVAAHVHERWKPLEVRTDGTIVAEDELLRRRVLIVPCDSVRAAELRAFAKADSPFLQAVWAIDERAGRAILELPEGERPRGPLSDEAIAEVGEALEQMHRHGIAHGQVDVEHVLLGRGRAILLLPERAGGTPDDDWKALRALRDPDAFSTSRARL